MDFVTHFYDNPAYPNNTYTVAPENPALGFYEKAGFTRVGTEAGALGDLLVMEWTL